MSMSVKSAATATVKFTTNSSKDFISELKERVDQYFENRQISRKANSAMVFKTVCMLLILFVPYSLIMTNLFPPWIMLGFAILMGFGMAGCGFCVGHDAVHGAYSNSPTVNALLGLTFEMVGASSYMWKITHNVIHHTYTNIQGIDEDLEVSPLLRLSPLSVHRRFHKYQHWYVLPTYSLTTLFWVFAKDYDYLLRRDLGPYLNIKHPPKEVLKLLALKLFYYAYMIVLPLIVLDITWWQFIIGFVAMHLTAGIILSVIFQLAHVCEGPEQFKGEDHNTMGDAWLVHQMRTTANFGRRNRLLKWYAGGLNFQIEHHLFPKTCSIHYPAISPIVKEIAEKYDVPYHEHSSFREALRSHWKMLKAFGDPSKQNSFAAANGS